VEGGGSQSSYVRERRSHLSWLMMGRECGDPEDVVDWGIGDGWKMGRSRREGGRGEPRSIWESESDP